MKKLLDIKRLKFYLWVGLAYILLGLFSNLAEHPDSFPQRLFNNIWAATYVIVLNYTFFEYTLPLLSRKRIFNSLLWIFAYLMLYSWGAYLWKYIGISLHIYTLLIT